MSRAALISVFACTLVPSCRTFGDEFEAVRERIRTYVDEDGIPSVAVAAVRGSDVVWLEAFGWADVENRVAATPNGYLLPFWVKLTRAEQDTTDLNPFPGELEH